MMPASNIHGRRSQSWYIDFIVSIVIFGLAIALFIKYLPVEKTDMADTILDSEIISDAFLSEGNPEDWSVSNVTLLGIITNDTLDERKWLDAADMGYSNIERLLPVRSDFIVYVEDDGDRISIAGEEYIGKPGINETNIAEMENARNIVAVNRLAAYDGKIVEVNIMVWSAE